MNILKTLQNNADLTDKVCQFCDFSLTEETRLGQDYSTNMPFRVFGRDGGGGEFGFIGDRKLANQPVGYVSSEGAAGKFADNLTDFFGILLYCPFWQDVLHFLPIEDNDNKSRFKKLYKKEFADSYTKEQLKMAEKLGLSFDPDIMQKLYKALAEGPKFKAFAPDGWEYDVLLPVPKISAKPSADSLANDWSIMLFKGINKDCFGCSQSTLKALIGTPNSTEHNSVMNRKNEYRSGAAFQFLDLEHKGIYNLHTIIVSEKVQIIYNKIDLFSQENAIELLSKKEKPVRDKNGYVMFPNMRMIMGGFEDKRVPKSSWVAPAEICDGRFVILFSKERKRFYQIFMNA